MAHPMSADAVLDQVFLKIRSQLLEVAAGLDRIERAEGGEAVTPNARLEQLHQAITLVGDGKPDRAARFLMLFSDPYDPHWSHPHPPHRSD